MRRLLCLIFIISVSACGGSGGSGGGGGGTLGTTPSALTTVENDLLALINAERVAAGLPELTRDAGLDQIELWFVNDMATNNYLSHTDTNGRSANERAQYYGGDLNVNCSEIIQWWGGNPSGQVHYNGYLNSPAHHSAYMEEGIYNLGPTNLCGIAALSGNGPTGTQFEGQSGSYTAVLFCDRRLDPLAIDPFSE